jgi:malate dehydrogenase (quinone)
VLSQFSTVLDILVIENGKAPGTVNSHVLNNSQTLHMGDIETNYQLTKALSVLFKAKLLERYVDAKNDLTLSQTCHKMVLGVGEEEVLKLQKRFKEFSPHFPELELIDSVEIALREPGVMVEREFDVPVCALASRDGRMVNYQKLSEFFLADAKEANNALEVCFGTPVTAAKESATEVILTTSKGEVHAQVVMFACGAYSLYFAHELGYGNEYVVLPVAGSFFGTKPRARSLLRGKVYTVQMDNIPFAAVHGDPDILGGTTRLGPTTKPLPVMERHRYETTSDFLKVFRGNVLKSIQTLCRGIFVRNLFWYTVKNVLFDTPFLGKWLFLCEARRIIPSLTYSDLVLRKGVGGIRPQLVNLSTMDLDMGSRVLHGGAGSRTFCVTAPSPGATVCLGDAVEVARMMLSVLKREHSFKLKEFEKTFGL